MRKSFYLMGTIALALLFMQTTISAQNLLLNPSFENGSSPYYIWGGASLQASNAHSGSYALAFSGTEGGAEYELSGLLPNTTYQLSGWAKSTNGEEIKLGVKYHGGNEKSVGISTATYSKDSIVFTTGVVHTSAIVYAYSSSNPTASGFVDDLSVEYQSASPYNLVWSDEFNVNGAVDPANWQFEDGFVRNYELQWYQMDNAWVDAGHLIIEGRRETIPNPNYDPFSSNWKMNREFADYSSSSINTGGGLHAWQYGRFEIRAKVTNLEGTWPAIWTLGTSCEWPSNGEIDILENYQNDILANFAWGSDTLMTAQWDASFKAVSSFGTNWVDNFHIWQLVWDANGMSIYVDDIFLNDVDLSTTINGSSDCAGQNPFHQPHYMLLNLAIGSTGGDPSETVFPNQYIVDYVRVYQESILTSITDNLKNKTVNVFPNPTDGMLTISGMDELCTIRILDIMGRVLKTLQSTVSSMNVNISEYPLGAYIFSISNNHGDLIDNVKVIKTN